jgi:hypothetical protein
MATAEADAAETRFAHLAAALTMLAVAVFLFGFSLTPQGRERRALFLSCATLFVFAGVVWALAFGLRGYAQPPKAAAMRFADGEVALNQGDAYAQFADMSAARTYYADAVVQVRRATALWPASISAYSDLAQALSDVTLPSDGAYVVPATRVLKAAVADDQRALKNGSESPTVTFDLGAELLFPGIVTNDDAQIANARSLSNTALARFVDERDQGLHPGDYLI